MKSKESKKKMSLEEYFDFLEQYWSLFPPPKRPKKIKEFTIVLL